VEAYFLREKRKQFGLTSVRDTIEFLVQSMREIKSLYNISLINMNERGFLGSLNLDGKTILK
jgi:hypothetical protein